MGAVSSECHEGGGRTIGIVPYAIAEGGGEGDEGAHKQVESGPDTIFTSSMHERKTKMASLAEGGFIALPGGYGTFEEVSIYVLAKFSLILSCRCARCWRL
jgi:predicted Rossmann-fold nucleotide-binding protein